MKKVLLIMFVIFAFGTMAKAQDAIGVRVGGGSFTGTELSYLKGLGDNRLELDAGAGFYQYGTALSLVGMYHWQFNIVDKLNWYVGPGAGFYYYTYNNAYLENHVAVGVGGQIGIEYNFNGANIPLMVSLDARPIWNVVHGDSDPFGWGTALGVRYTF